MIGEIESLLSLLERLRRFLKGRSKSKNSDMISTRIVTVCEAHGIHRNQIPRVFGPDISVYDMVSDARMLRKINDALIENVVSTLGVKRDWLEGASKKIYQTYDFYKQPDLFRKFLLERLKGERDIAGVLLFPEGKGHSSYAILLLQETVGYLDDKPYYKYYICDNWYPAYWKARGYLTACIAICWKHRVYVKGKFVPLRLIESMEGGEAIIRFGEDGIFGIRGRQWDCEDMVSSPEVFLEGVDAEQENYGIISGLQFWIELQEKGFMDDGFNDFNAKNRFIDKLNEVFKK